MMRSYTAAQLRTAEAFFLARTAPGALMRRAAWAVAAAVTEALRGEGTPPQGMARDRRRRDASLPGRRVVLLVGVGSNGGDALHAGAYLRRRGVWVTAVCVAVARAHSAGLAAFRAAGGRVLAVDDAAVPTVVGEAEVLVDGLVGLGAAGPLRPVAAGLVELANAAAAVRVAVDVPSGVDPTTGMTAGAAFRADVTVAMGAPASGLLATAAAGRIDLAEIGMDPLTCQPPIPPDAVALDEAEVAAALPRPGADDDKFSLGVTGVVAGSARYPGAAVLSVGGAVSTRPGLVRYAGPQAAAVVARWPETVVTDGPADAGRVQAWVVGPGIGTDGAALRLLRDVLAADVPVLVDADGLTLLSALPGVLADRAAKGLATVLTPHAGEFARLFPDLADRPELGRLASARTAAARSGAVVVLKGHRTVIASPTGEVYVNLTGSPRLATAGSGDVLAGMVGALLAAGVDPVVAAAAGTHLHGLAGARSSAGASGLLAAVSAMLAARPDRGLASLGR